MNWKPNKLIAILLGFFFQPLGMLYIAKPKLAGLYLLLNVLVGVLDLWGGVNPDSGIQNVPLYLLLMFACAIHIYFLLRNYQPLMIRPWFSKWYGLSVFLIVLTALLTAFRAFLFEPYRIPVASMAPTLEPGQIMLVKKWGYGNYGAYGISFLKTEIHNELKRGDIVAFEHPKQPTNIYVKRLIGLPGDIVEYGEDYLSVNRHNLYREYMASNDDYDIYKEQIADSAYSISLMKGRSAMTGSATVPEGHIFVLGDNRDNSNDSRYWGFVPMPNIVGKVVSIF